LRFRAPTREVFPAPRGVKKSHKSEKYSGGRKWGMTRDLSQIRRDWKQWPDANVGVRTGSLSSIFVVEADTMEDTASTAWPGW